MAKLEPHEKDKKGDSTFPLSTPSPKSNFQSGILNLYTKIQNAALNFY